MKKILIIGDSCSDAFVYGNCERLSPEAPVPILKYVNTTYNGGMAINVYNNIKALNIKCDIITNDIRPIKTRYIDVASNQMILRVDVNDKIDRISNNILNKIKFNQYSTVIISDYNKGYLDVEDIKFIASKHENVFIDSKKKFGEWCNNIKFIKINESEYNNNIKYFNEEYKGNLIITLGKSGCILKNTNEKFIIEDEHDARDLSGAGDTFLAALVANYIKNNDLSEAIKFANKCASWVVTQKGVAVINLNKIEI